MKLRRIIVSIATLLVGFPVSGAAFTVIDGNNVDVAPSTAPPFYHWDLREFSNCDIPYAINKDGTGDMAGEHAEIDKAFQVWEDVTPACIQFTNVGNTTIAAVAAEVPPRNTLFWDNDLNSGDAWDPPLLGGAVATTNFTVNAATGVLTEVDIVFDDQQYAWNAGVQNWAGNVLDVWVVAAHEIGHFCGFGENLAVGTGAEALETVNEGPFAFPAGATLNFTFNGVAVAVTFPGPQTAAQAAATIQTAIDNTPGVPAAAVVAGGTVRIQRAPPPALAADVIIVTGGTALGLLGLPSGESGLSTMSQNEARRLVTLDQRTLSRDDVDALNFLYTPDLGDAPDPFTAFNRYPSLVHSRTTNSTLNGVPRFVPAEGAEHIFGFYGADATPRYQYEWLGGPADRIDDNPAECEAQVPDNDAYDDGVTFSANFVPGGPPVTVTIEVNTDVDLATTPAGHNYATPMYLNGWFDWNADGDWTDLGEHAIGAGAGAFSVTAPGSYLFSVSAPAGARCGGWSRFRLDWGEDVQQVAQTDTTLLLEKGAAQFGEVEDYPIPYDFEVDFFPVSRAELDIRVPVGSPVLNLVTLDGPTNVCVDITNVADGDGNSRDEVHTEIVSMYLTGDTPWGAATLRIRDEASCPFQPTVGEIEETFDDVTGTLDIPPFGVGTADSFFDVYAEVDLPGLLGGVVLHTHDPKRMSGLISHKPPIKNEIYENPDFITLYAEDDTAVGEIGPNLHVPVPPCGDGIVDIDLGEQCDDGGIADGDCCDSTCQIEPDGSSCEGHDDCFHHQCLAGVCTPGNGTCGDGVTLPSCDEECDDGNNTSGDGCSAVCEHEITQDGDQVGCINAVNKAASKLVQTQGKENAKCIKDAGAGKLETTADVCLTSDRKDKVFKAQQRVTDAFERKCEVTPDFGFSDLETIYGAAVQEEIALVEDIYGAPLDAAIILAIEDKAGAVCQASISKTYEKLLITKIKLWLRCKKNGLKGEAIVSASSLAGCLDDITADLRGKVGKAISKLQKDAFKKCVNKEVLFDLAFPGQCREFLDPNEFALCVDARVECAVCRILNAVDVLDADCDLFDDGEINGSCQDGT